MTKNKNKIETIEEMKTESPVTDGPVKSERAVAAEEVVKKIEGGKFKELVVIALDTPEAGVGLEVKDIITTNNNNSFPYLQWVLSKASFELNLFEKNLSNTVKEAA